ncbi:zinc ribbon domain-containing protein [candidate division KSB1 bacterium]
MKQKECPSCAVDVDVTAEQCPVCGYEFPQKKMVNNKFVMIIMFAIVVYLVYKIAFW